MALLSKSTMKGAFAQARPARRVAVVVRAQQQKPQLPAFVKPAMVAGVANLIAALPSSADAGKLFDFNLTLPVSGLRGPGNAGRGLGGAASRVRSALRPAGRRGPPGRIAAACLH
jgi:hypothetical protein